MNPELLAAFMTIATAVQQSKVDAAIEYLAANYQEHMGEITKHIDSSPRDVIETLKLRFPDKVKLLSSPLAPRAVERIQAYLKQKGAQDG